MNCVSVGKRGCIVMWFVGMQSNMSGWYMLIIACLGSRYKQVDFIFFHSI